MMMQMVCIFLLLLFDVIQSMAKYLVTTAELCLFFIVAKFVLVINGFNVTWFIV